MKLFFQKIGHGPTMIILHGLYGSSDNWISIARRLADIYTVYLVDQRNHGKSPHQSMHSYPLMAQDINELMVSEGIENSVFIGHSMGGKVAMQFSILYPEKVSALIIVDIGPAGYAEIDNYSPQVITHLNIMNAMLSIDFSKFTSRVEIERELAQMITDIHVRQFIMKNVQRDAENNFRWKLNLGALSKALPAIMGPISIDKNNVRSKLCNFPVLFIKGERSNYITQEQILLIKEYFPKALIESISDAGHWVHADKPETFVKMVEEFLRTIQL